MSAAEQTWFTTPRGNPAKGEIVARETVASARGGVVERLTVEYRDIEFIVERPVREQ